MSTWDDQAVLKAFGELTGIFFRIVGEEQRRLAWKFSQHFSLEELETVVEWTKRQIAKPGSKYQRGSLQWRTIMGTLYGDELVTFQERLGLAKEEIGRREWRPKLALSRAAGTVPAPEPVKPVAAPVSAEEQARIAESVRQQQADFFAQMNGGRQP